jgi:tetratricopeptide (TPR) repeat protein/sugar lactone lactonase YvrE
VTAFSPDGRYFVTSSRSGEHAVGDAKLWDAATGRLIAALPQINYVSAIAFSPDSKLLVTGGYDCALQFWDPATGKQIGAPLHQVDIVLGLTFSPDGKTLAVGHADSYSGAAGLVLWDVASLKEVGRVRFGDWWAGQPGFLLRYSPAGQRLLVVAGPTLSVLDASTRQPLWPMISEPGAINSVQWSPDGKQILLATTEGTVQLRDADTGKPIGAPMFHHVGANVATFSPDAESRFILVGYADGSARLLDRASHKPIGPVVVQNSPIRGVTFLPDGKSFLTTAEDGTTRHWPVPAPVTEPLDRLRLHLQVHAGLQMNDGQTVQLLESADWEQHRQQLEALADTTDRSPPGSISARAYHDARAGDAEQDGDSFAARWHLNQLLTSWEGEAPAEPGTWLTYARRARTWTNDNQMEQADRDYARARELASPEHLLCWYRQCHVACQSAKRWPTALWYLEHALALVPEDWQLYAERALTYEKLGKFKEYATDLAAAAARGADSSVLVRLADAYARQGQWDKAAAAFATASRRGPLGLNAWHCHALVCLKVGDTAGYRRICSLLLASVGQTPHPQLANGVAWTCAVGPAAVRDYAQPLALAERAAEKAPAQVRAEILNTLGALLYRAGRFQEAVSRLRESIQVRDGVGVVQDWIFLAMAQQRLGDTSEAQKFLAKVQQAREANPGALWNNVEVELLRQEVQALVEGSK